VLFGASLKIGALIGGAPYEDADLLYDFGVNIGLGFQLKDDLLDTFGNEDIFGKKTGGDIITNKKTFLYLKAIEIADNQTKEELILLYNSPNIDHNHKINLTKSIFTKLKVDDAANIEIDKFFNAGIESLNKINVSNEKKEYLREVAVKMIDRNKWEKDWMGEWVNDLNHCTIISLNNSIIFNSPTFPNLAVQSPTN